MSETGNGELLSIGQLAKQANVSSRAIRYYEELGILPHPPRSPGGTRRYPPEYRFYLEGALALKEVGFTLDEIRLLGRLALGQPLTPEERQQTQEIVSENMRWLERKIRILQRLRRVLVNDQHGEHRSEDERLSSLAEILRDAGDGESGLSEP